MTASKDRVRNRKDIRGHLRESINAKGKSFSSNHQVGNSWGKAIEHVS